MYNATYIWTHLPSGNEGETKKEFISRTTFLDALASWNRQGKGTWQYREVEVRQNYSITTKYRKRTIVVYDFSLPEGALLEILARDLARETGSELYALLCMIPGIWEVDYDGGAGNMVTIKMDGNMDTSSTWGDIEAIINTYLNE